MKLNILICYATYSGNTKETAELIEEQLKLNGYFTTLFEITENTIPQNIEHYDIIFFGTFTWDYGYTPDFVKDFIADIGYKPKYVATFGTGDTQFGEETDYCGAVKRIHKFYKSPWEPLFIEQSPRGSQEEKIVSWVRRLITSEITKNIKYKRGKVPQ